MQGVPRPSPTDLPGVTSFFLFARARDGVATRRDATSRAAAAARRLVKSLGEDRFYVDGSRHDHRLYGSVELRVGVAALDAVTCRENSLPRCTVLMVRFVYRGG